MENEEAVKNDFNEIAGLPAPPRWNHNNCYFGYLMQFLPERFERCLEIGCGQGELCALLSERAGHVTGVDFAERMIAAARARNSRPNIEYRCENIMEMDIPDGSFDVVITTATAHHLPFEWLLDFAARVLCWGGTLVILDLARAETLSDHLLWGFAALPNLCMNLLKNGRLKEDPHSAAVWEKHGRHDVYLSLREVQRLSESHLHNIFLQRLLYWRYVLVWRKQMKE